MSDQRERHPLTGGWTHWGRPQGIGSSTPASAWSKGRFFVISSLDLAEYPIKGAGIGLQWHISASITPAGYRPMPRRATDGEMEMILRCFRLDGAEEDNHEPGRARHFWMPVDPRYRVACQCLSTERVVVEPDGHRWTTPVDGPCNGCAHGLRFGIDCPIHGAPTIRRIGT